MLSHGNNGTSCYLGVSPCFATFRLQPEAIDGIRHGIGRQESIKMPLSDTTIRGLQPSAKPYKRADTLGLYLLVQPNGSRLWRLNYRLAGKQKTLALGIYPTVKLHEAREARDAAKRQLRQGTDPG